MELIYVLLWLLALGNLLIAFFDLYNKKEEFIRQNSWLLSFFTIATIVQQFLLYLDLHAIDAHPEKAASNYPDWVGSGTEWLLRFLIIFSLLFGVGKIGSSLRPYFDSVNVNPIFNLLFGSTSDKSSYELFLVWCPVVFSLLVIWNICALSHCLPKKTLGLSSNLRIILFTILSFLALIYSLLLIQETMEESTQLLLQDISRDVYYVAFFILAVAWTAREFGCSKMDNLINVAMALLILEILAFFSIRLFIDVDNFTLSVVVSYVISVTGVVCAQWPTARQLVKKIYKVLQGKDTQ